MGNFSVEEVGQIWIEININPRRKRCRFGRIASLITAVKLSGVELFAYSKATLEAIASGHLRSRIDQPLPWAFIQR